MSYVKIHAQNQSEIFQLLAIIDLLEEQAGHNTRLNEHRYAGVEKEGKEGRKQFLTTPLDSALLIAHFHETDAAKTEVKYGELHIHYAAEEQPYTQLLEKLRKTGSIQIVEPS